MNRPVSVGFVVLVVVVVVAGSSVSLAVAETPAVTPQERSLLTASSQSDSTAATADFVAQEFDTTTFEITVYENGSATWTFHHRQRLEDSEDEANFETFAEEFESEETDVYDRFRTQAEALTETGGDVTDREMEARNFNRSARIEEGLNPTGVVEMSFVWDGFAATEDGSVVVGDVFRDTYIASDQTIVFQAGGNLVFERIAPTDAQYDSSELENADTVRWSGEREFLDGHPRVVLDDPTRNAGSSDGPISTVTGSGTDVLWPLVGLLVLLSIGGITLWYRRTDRTDDEAFGATTESPATVPTTEGPNGASEQPSGGAIDETDTLADEELLTDEDRVVTLIRENGGRMKQVNIVEETSWSKSKVSMLLSDMEEEGTISKLRVGRENIISLEGFEPEATKSPFDE